MRRKTAAPQPEHLLGTREQWEKRQAQWREFNEWERRQPPDNSTPAQRIAWAGSVLEFARRFRRRELDPAGGVKELERHVARMKQALALLGGADHRP